MFNVTWLGTEEGYQVGDTAVMTIDAYDKKYADADPKPDYTVIEPTEQVL